MGTDDLRAQARITSRDVMRVMGGVAFVLGLMVLAVAIATGLAKHEIDPARALAYVSMIVILSGGLTWLVLWITKKISEEFRQEIEHYACHCESGTNGQVKDNTVALIEGRRF